ncbi:MAG TPA: DNA mismatch repair endonuclease MutL [Terriglobales bacterium]|nr:DNA mismatch repair endonuclease MutL [Terriglobales bacterium]
MALIRVLTDQIANKIAAGEVVERPASVVKELLENSLDAGARSIDIAVEAGGKSKIRVTDDGSGMLRDDALLSLERHATSKLSDEESLSAISTLGFRGEALPAIASVSHFILATAPALNAQGDAGEGTRIEVRAGVIESVNTVGLPAGTSISVSNLFANIPARKKFLKSDDTELGHISTLVTHYALAYPEIRFKLSTPHRDLLSLAPVPSHAQRLEQIFGEETFGQCIEFNHTANLTPEADVGIFGFASRPELQKLNRNSIFIFVNRRLVRDRLLQHAVSSAYYNLLPAETYPAVLLFLDLPFSQVDVNVHPSKTEVRFQGQSLVHDAVRDAIRSALSTNRPVPSFLRERTAHPTAAASFSQPQTRPWSDAVAMPYSPGAAADLGIATEDLPRGFHLVPAPPEPQPQRFAFPPSAVHSSTQPAALPSTQAQELGELQPLGQIHDSFIVASGPSGLWLIDQHVAHERILFEQIGRDRLAGSIESQRLLVPVVLPLDAARVLSFAECADELAAAGFEAEPFGRNTIVVKATPAGITADKIERLLQELLQAPGVTQHSEAMTTLRTRITATIACHAAIKVHMKLTPEKMTWLLDALAQTEYPMTCPHGRPVMLRYSTDEILRAFKRLH